MKPQLMRLYLQYHNYDKEGLPLCGDSGRYGIYTRREYVRGATGGRVFLIVGLGTPRRYFLWDTFVIDQVTRAPGNRDLLEASGPGWHLRPPQRLEGRQFMAFKHACANFIGFFNVSEMPYAKTLHQFAEKWREPNPQATQAFLDDIGGLLQENSDLRALADHLSAPSGNLPSAVRKPPRKMRPPATTSKAPQMRALSIRQPHAEAIFRGTKTIEYRSGPTKIRGRIQIYAGLGRYSRADEAEMLEEYGIRDVKCDDLPRGVIVGTVELVDCDGGDWHLKNPKRAAKLVKPKNHPQPVWFNPF